MTKWVPALVHQPADGTTVWIRRVPIFDTPVQAEWGEVTQVFNVTTDAGFEAIPLYAVHSWRPLS